MKSCRHLDESECIARAQRGDVLAFSELVSRHQDRIYRFLARLTRSPDDALDLTQETFLNAYQALGRWRPQARFSTWLFQIARNLAFDQLRRSRRVEFVTLEEEQASGIQDAGPTPEAALQTTQRLHALERALAHAGWRLDPLVARRSRNRHGIGLGHMARRTAGRRWIGRRGAALCLGARF